MAPRKPTIPRHNTRGWVEYVEDSVIRFHCSAGHTWTEDLNRKSLPVSKRIGPWGSAYMSKWWSKENGGVNLWCKECAKAGKRVR